MNINFNSGDIAIVKESIHGHLFEIGESVYIESVGENDYLVSNDKKNWWMTDEELLETGCTVNPE